MSEDRPIPTESALVERIEQYNRDERRDRLYSIATRLVTEGFDSFLTSRDVDLVSFTHVIQVKPVDITAHVLNFINEVEDGLVVSIEVPSDLSGRLRSHLFDDVEHLFEAEAVLAKERV